MDHLHRAPAPPQYPLKMHQTAHIGTRDIFYPMFEMIRDPVAFPILTLTDSSVTHKLPPNPQHSSLPFQSHQSNALYHPLQQPFRF